MSSERLLRALVANYPMPGGGSLELWLQSLPVEILCVFAAATADQISFQTRGTELGTLTASFVEHMHRMVGTPRSEVAQPPGGGR